MDRKKFISNDVLVMLIIAMPIIMVLRPTQVDVLNRMLHG